MTLRAAIEALERRDLVAALGRLLDAWRASRDPAVADLIDIVSGLVARKYEDILRPRLKKYERAARWRRIEPAHDPLDLPVLLRVRWSDVPEILERLATWDDDPRIAAWIVEAIAAGGWRGDRATPPGSVAPRLDRRVVCELLERFRDRRGVDALVAAGAPWNDVARSIVANTGQRCDLEELAAIHAVLARQPSDAESDALEVRRRFERVFAQPDDDGERSVLGDWLIERGDPRGELIALQLAPRTRARLFRERALLERHGRKWYAELATAIHWPKFERGFIATCMVNVPRLRSLTVRSNEWSTVREVVLYSEGIRCPYQFAAVLPAARSLGTIWNAGSQTLLALAAGEWPEVRMIRFDIRSVEHEAERSEVATLDGLPRLHHLALHGGAEPNSWIIGGPGAGCIRSQSRDTRIS